MYSGRRWCLIIVCCFGTCCAFDHEMQHHQLHAMHGIIDKDGNGKLSRHEVLTFSHEMHRAKADADAEAIWGEVDLDEDGFVNYEEWKTMVSNMHDNTDSHNSQKRRVRHEHEKFNLADFDGDGRLNQTELALYFYPELEEDLLKHKATSSWQRKDRNRDGKISKSEFFGEHIHGETMEWDAVYFNDLDKDGDGFLDWEEFMHWESGHYHLEASVDKMFEHADVDSDSHVTAHELSNAREHFVGTHVHSKLQQWIEHHEL